MGTDGTTRVGELVDELEALLKTNAVGVELGRRGVNTSIALLAAQGLAAYFSGNKLQAADDLRTAADEIRARLERSE